MSKYDDWIAANVPEPCGGECHRWAALMQDWFSELIHVYGIYRDPDGVEIKHGWCEGPNGEIVDPTVTQFLPGGEYIGKQVIMHTARGTMIRMDLEDERQKEEFRVEKERLWNSKRKS